MMLEYSTGELLTRAAFMYHADQGYDALRHHAVLKGVGMMLGVPGVWCGEGLVDFVTHSTRAGMHVLL